SELKDHSDTIYGVAFSPDGKLLASASADRAVKVWEVGTGKRLYTLGDPTDWVYALTWHPDGKRLAAAGVDKRIRVWEATAEGGGRPGRRCCAPGAPGRGLGEWRAGRFLAWSGGGKVVKKGDGGGGVERLVSPPQADTALSLAVRPDGKQLAIGRFDGVLQL